MQKTSSLYRTEMKKPVAAQAEMRIVFGLTDTDAAATCTPDAPGGVFFSRPAGMLTEDAPGAAYATFEPGRMRADGAQRIAPRAAEKVTPEGFVSAALCGADGAFAADSVPEVRLRFAKPHTVPGLTFTFDAVCGDWPAALRLTAYAGGAVLLDKTYAPNAAVWTSPDAIERFDGLVVRFVRMARPWRRARLQQLLFGFGLVFDSRSVTQAARKAELDPIGRRLPVNTFDFTIVNINTLTGGGAQYLYDPDNARGVYRYIGGQNPVRVEFGQRLPSGLTWGDAAAGSWGALELSDWRAVYAGGVTEWTPGGRYYLTGRPTVDGLTARFAAQDALSGLTQTCVCGVYAPGGRSLYALAQDVLEDSGLRPFASAPAPWRLWEGLKELFSAAPLPAKPHRELLQLIAHAACCVLFTDREGCVRIEPMDETQYDRTVDFSEMLARPKVSQIPLLRAVECPVYAYVPEAQRSELHSETLTLSGTAQLLLTFPQAAEVQVQAQGAQITAQAVYAGAARLTLAGSGPAQLTVTGRRLRTGKRIVTAQNAQFDAASQENGAVETLDNPLITDADQALRVAAWVRDWLLLRSTCAFDYRGAPELDPGDRIFTESPFAPAPVPARVLKSELTYTGALRGKLTVKRL